MIEIRFEAAQLLGAIIFQLEIFFYTILNLLSLEIHLQEVRVHMLEYKYSVGFNKNLVGSYLKKYFFIENTGFNAFVERERR